MGQRAGVIVDGCTFTLLSRSLLPHSIASTHTTSCASLVWQARCRWAALGSALVPASCWSRQCSSSSSLLGRPTTQVSDSQLQQQQLVRDN